jgi:lipopolysaccharide transport system ATP-binding protein
VTPAIEVRGLSKRFRVQHAWRPRSFHEALTHGFRRLRPAETFWALREVSLTVPPGGAIGLVGNNGAGKSTLLRLVARVGRPDAGTITVRGRASAILDLGAGFHGDLTGRENLVLAGIINGLSRREVHQAFDRVVAFAGLEEAIDNPLRTFSTGMRMRLAFSIATVTQPDVLLVDEVLGVGDVAFQQKCAGRIAELRANGSTMVVCSHDGDSIRELCDQAVWLDQGRVAMAGPADDVVSAYEGAAVAGA